MSRVSSEGLKDRLDVYRALLRRDAAGIPELERLVAMLESELRAANDAPGDGERRSR